MIVSGVEGLNFGVSFLSRVLYVELEVAVENRLLQPALSRIEELAREGELDRKLSGGGLVAPSAPGEPDSARDMPGNPNLRDASASASS